MNIRYRRDREGRTDYKRRLVLLKSGKPRLTVRRTLNNTIVSIVRFEPDGDTVIATVHSASLKKQGWTHGTGTIPAAYVTGYLAGAIAKKHGIDEAILDIGRIAPIKGGRIFAALKGAIDAGLVVPHSPEALPTPERLFGDHIKAHRGTDVRADVEKIIGA
jgi:large subunit ribosomal protein L18